MWDDDLPLGDGPAGGPAWGLAGLLIGCTLLVAACALMVFNVLLFRGGLGGVPLGPAQVGAAVGAGGVAVLGLLAVGFGLRGWSRAARTGESTAFGVAGTAAAAAGLLAWLIAGTDLILILGVFR